LAGNSPIFLVAGAHGLILMAAIGQKLFQAPVSCKLPPWKFFLHRGGAGLGPVFLQSNRLALTKTPSPSNKRPVTHHVTTGIKWYLAFLCSTTPHEGTLDGSGIFMLLSPTAGIKTMMEIRRHTARDYSSLLLPGRLIHSIVCGQSALSRKLI